MTKLHSDDRPALDVRGDDRSEKNRAAGSRGDTQRQFAQCYACHAILSAANDLLDCAMQAPTIDDALELAKVVKVLRERIDAIADRALQRADELCG